jgi:hypothetical protein
MKTYKLIFLMASTFIFACSKSGKRALESGNFYNAVIQSIEKLKRDSNNDKALEVLPNAYQMASDDLLRDISRAKNANQQFRFENVLENYKKLNSMHELIVKCVPCRNIVNPSAYYKEFDNSVNLAAKERYDFAQNLLNKNNLESSRLAYDNFLTLQTFAPNYEDVSLKIEEALDKGSYHVVLEPPRVNSKLYALSNDYFQSRIDEFLRTNRRMNKFIRFYEPNEAKAMKLVPDQVIKLEFIDFVVGETSLKSDRFQVTSKDSVVTGSVKVEGKNLEVKGLVYATLVKNIKRVSSRGLLYMDIVDYKSGKTLLRDQLPGEFNWINEWATFNGDERALTDAELKMTRSREDLPPPPQQLFVEFCKPIYDQFTSRVRRFYDKY